MARATTAPSAVETSAPSVNWARASFRCRWERSNGSLFRPPTDFRRKEFSEFFFSPPTCSSRSGSVPPMTTMRIPSGNTVYTHPVAKVMPSIPDDLLDRLDAQARANRETRSGFLRRLAERELDAEYADQRKRLEDLLGPPVDLG